MSILKNCVINIGSRHEKLHVEHEKLHEIVANFRVYTEGDLKLTHFFF